MSHDIQKQIHRLRSGLPLVGWEMQRLAIKSLVNDGSPEAMMALIEIVMQPQHAALEKPILQALSRRAYAGDAAARDALCRLIAQHDHPTAWEIVCTGQYVPHADDLQAHFAAKLSAMISENHQGSRARHAMRLLNAMAEAGSAAARDALCALVIEWQHPRALEIVMKKRYAPSNPYQRAMFYALTGQWAQYDAFDFEGRFLRAAYKSASRALQRRIATVTRQAGRADVLAAFAASEHLVQKMEHDDWAAMLEQFRRHQAWDELWRMAQIAPARWSMQILSCLNGAGWQPLQSVERDEFAALVRLAEACQQHATRSESWLLPCVARLEGYADAVTSVSLHQEGRIFTVGSHGNIIRIWNLPDEVSAMMSYSAKPIESGHSPYRRIAASKTLRGHNGRVTCLAACPDGSALASGDEDGIVRLWNFPGGLPLNRLSGHSAAISALSLHHAQSLLVSGSDDGRICFWNWQTGQRRHAVIDTGSAVSALTTDSAGQHVISGHANGQIRLWNAAAGRLLATFAGHDGAVTCLAADHRAFMSGGADHQVRFWSYDHEREICAFEGHTDRVTAGALSADGTIIVSGSADGSIRVWSVPEHRLIKTLRDGQAEISALALSANGRILVGGMRDNTVRLWGFAPVDIAQLNVENVDEEDVLLLQRRRHEPEISDAERVWLDFLLQLISWQRRFDIDIGMRAEYLADSTFDIEIESLTAL
ncbi:WD-repeat protein [Candidatus Moduliflexus flocculans]|uniref:WD-repeat protein n=1 Tax=Candidatus Moduliflexus flocculans TaxID=1499966 RepID=A0A081BMJ5_9BACT|nr:WD-repeat protein [Candidatus Moduliflexus flocculans]